MTKKALAFRLANGVIGFWLAFFFVYVFLVFVSGGTVSEPNIAIAITELILGALAVVWFGVQIVYWVVKAWRKDV